MLAKIDDSIIRFVNKYGSYPTKLTCGMELYCNIKNISYYSNSIRKDVHYRGALVIVDSSLDKVLLNAARVIPSTNYLL